VLIRLLPPNSLSLSLSLSLTHSLSGVTKELSGSSSSQQQPSELNGRPTNLQQGSDEEKPTQTLEQNSTYPILYSSMFSSTPSTHPHEHHMVSQQISKNNRQNYIPLKLSDDDFLPVEFFYIRQEIDPKAKRPILLACAFFCYVVTIITFVGIFINEMNQRTTETIVTSTDIGIHAQQHSTNSPWSCQMLSITSKTGVLDDTEEPALSYSLLQVNENYQTCLSNINYADPCSYANQHGLYFVDGQRTTYTSLEKISYITNFNDTMVYFVTLADMMLIRYNLSSGSIDTLDFSTVDDMEFVVPGVVVDGNGRGYILGYEFHYNTYIFAVINDDLQHVLTSRTTQSEADCGFRGLVRDNLYNIYGFTSRGEFIALPVNSDTGHDQRYQPSSCFPDFDTVAFVNETVELATLYWNESDIVSPLNIYFMNTYNESVYLYHYHNNVTTLVELFNLPLLLGHSMEVVVDKGTGIVSLYFVWVELNSRGYYTNIYTIDSATMSNTLVSEVTGWSCFTLFTHQNTLLGGANYNLVFMDAEELIQGNLQNKALVMDFTGATTGWLVCNSTIVPVGSVTFATELQFERKCVENGISWYASFKKTYHFTDSSMHAYTASIALPLCSRVEYLDICTVVGNLPPYACSRQVRATIFTILSAAVANSQLVFAIVCFAAGLVMQFFSTRKIVKDTADVEEGTSCGVVEDESIAKGDEELEPEISSIELAAATFVDDGKEMELGN
jgi:hypothetical protein